MCAGNHISISLANAPRAATVRTAAATAPVSPDTATDDGEFTTESSSQPGVSAITSAACSGVMPRTATRYGPVSRSSTVARAMTIATASGRVMAPAT